MNTFINVILFLFILSSCDNSTDVNINDSNNLIPLALGNEWRYERAKYRFNRSDSLTTLSDSTSIVMEVVELDSIGNFSGFKIEHIPFWFSYKPGTRIYYYKEDGLYYVQSVGLVYPPPEPTEKKLLSFPTSIGDKHSFGSFTIHTIATNEIVKLFSKTYNCIRYSVSSKDEVVGELWITPSIGIIKSWQYLGVNTYYYYLTTYNLN